MYTSLKNFAHCGKTYLEGDNVPSHVAEAMGATFAEAPKTATKPKSYKTVEVKASPKGEY